MHSMTGMGKASGFIDGRPVRVEIKSVNHRHCEVSSRVPGKFIIQELAIQQLIKKSIARGSVDVFLFEDKAESLSRTEQVAFRAYYKYLQKIKKELGLNDEITLAQLISGIGSWLQKGVPEKRQWVELAPLLKRAISDLQKMRHREGMRIKKNLQTRFGNIARLKQTIEAKAQGISQQLEEKLKARVEEKLGEGVGLDSQRLHAEVIYYLDRLDVSEELERIQSHLQEAESFLNSSEPIGRKLDFLLQEFNREFNTLSSKSQDVAISHLTVEAKAELEKMREQVQNIE